MRYLPKKISLKKNLNYHNRTIHAENRLRYKCGKCDIIKTYAVPRGLIEHMSKSHEIEMSLGEAKKQKIPMTIQKQPPKRITPRKIFKCQRCEKEFYCFSNYRRHMNTINCEEQSPRQLSGKY